MSLRMKNNELAIKQLLWVVYAIYFFGTAGIAFGIQIKNYFIVLAVFFITEVIRFNYAVRK